MGTQRDRRGRFPLRPICPKDARGQVPRWCGAENKRNIMTTTPEAAMRGSMLALPIGRPSRWALYPTLSHSAGGDVERDGLGHRINEPHGVGCQSLLCGDCWWPEKVVKGIYITFCIRPWSSHKGNAHHPTLILHVDHVVGSGTSWHASWNTAFFLPAMGMMIIC